MEALLGPKRLHRRQVSVRLDVAWRAQNPAFDRDNEDHARFNISARRSPFPPWLTTRDARICPPRSRPMGGHPGGTG
jgi:hypothetical protein